MLSVDPSAPTRRVPTRRTAHRLTTAGLRKKVVTRSLVPLSKKVKLIHVLLYD